MAINKTHYNELPCDRCKFAGKPSIAVKYCQNCNGYFCSRCSTSHRKSYTTSGHVMVTLDTRRKYFSHPVAPRIQEKCITHGAPLISFCNVHDELCCSVCVYTIHQECKDVPKLQEAAQEVHSQRKRKDLEMAIKKLRNQYEEIKSSKQDYINSIDQDNDSFIASVKMFRNTLHSLLNRLEYSIIDKMEELQKGRTASIKDHVKTCQTAVTVLDESYKKLDISFRQTDSEMFICTKRIQTVVNKYAEILSQLQQPQEDRKHFVFVPDVTIEKFLTSLNVLGDIKTEVLSKRDYFSPTSRRTTPRSKLTPSLTTEINVRLKDDKKPCFITGTSFLNNDSIVVVDNSNECVKLFDPGFKPISCVQLESAPRDLTTLSHYDVAVTLPNERAIQTFKIVNNKLETAKHIALDIECYGITTNASDLYVTSGWSSEKEIQVISPKGEIRRRIVPDKSVFRYPLYIVIDAKNATIYVSDYVNGIIALDMSGKVMFKCRHLETSSYYKGIALFGQSQLYTCTWQQNTVSRVANNGKQLDPFIIWTTNERRKPISIAFNAMTKNLILSFCGMHCDTINVYKCS